ncbi:MAG: DUF4124 domain-containing protein [Xanthomonadales bacterium]|nr:DUF4124 domain-containing protein [Xanthomonadales bacterium]
MAMESSLKITSKKLVMLIAVIVSLSVTSLFAESYRWKDKDGKTHYGAVVPAEYADQPYDVLNNSGQVIEHVEDTSIPMEVIVEKQIKERGPLISEETRQLQADRLLVIRYGSEEEITAALELEIAQLGYDTKVINKSYETTTLTIRNEIFQAANLQRSGQQVTAKQQKEIDRLYARVAQDERKRASMSKRENRIRTRFQKALERYRFLTSDAAKTEEIEIIDQEETDQG